MSDIKLTHSSEFMVTLVNGITEAGIEFVDSYYTTMMVVVDAGTIVIPTTMISILKRKAAHDGLVWSEEKSY